MKEKINLKKNEIIYNFETRDEMRRFLDKQKIIQTLRKPNENATI